MGLRENILTEPVSELEMREPVLVRRSTSVRDTIARMKQRRLGCAIVVDDNDRPVGKFTERKLMKLLVKDPAQLDDPVERHMYASADTIPQDRPIIDMIRMMETRGLRFICAVDERGAIAGLTGQKGLMEYIAEHFPRQVKAQTMEPKLYLDQREGA